MENTYVHYKCSQQWLYGINRNYAICCDCTIEHDLTTDVVTFTIETHFPAAIKLFTNNKLYIKSN